MDRFNYDLDGIISEAINFAYESTSIDRNIPIDIVHRSKTCMVMSESIIRYLGFLYKINDTYKDKREGWGVNVHEYVVISSPNLQNEVIVDPTWQQLLKNHNKIHPSMPRALVGTRSDSINIARSYGMDEDVLQLWRPISEFQKPRDVISRHPSSRVHPNQVLAG